MLTVVIDIVTLLGFGITLWQYCHANRKHKLEIDSLKRENASAWSRCTLSWIFLLYPLALFLVLALATSRKTA